MKKGFIVGMLCVFLTGMIGCGGGGDSGGTSGIASITGTWTGSITFVLVADPAVLFSFDMSAVFAQTGSAVTGTWDFSFGGSPVASGDFESTTRSGDSMGGLIDDNGTYSFDAPIPFTATIGVSTMVGTGAVQMSGDDFDVSFNLSIT